MRILFRFYDQGDSGGAAPGNTGVAPAPVTQPAAVVSPVVPGMPVAPAANVSEQAPVDPAVSALREKMKAQVAKWKTNSDASQKAQDLSNDQRQISPDLVNGQRQVQAQAQQPVTAPVTPEVKPPETPVEVKPPETKPPETPAEQKLVFFGNEWTPAQVEQYIKYAHEANQNIGKLQEREKTLNEREAKLKAMSESPNMVLVEELTNDEALRAKVMALMNEEGDPTALTNMKVQEANSQISALQNEVQSLKAMLQEKHQREEAATKQAEQERLANEEAATIGAVRTSIVSQLEKAGLPPEMLDDVGQRLVFRVNQGQVPFSAPELIAEGQKIINAQIELINKKLNDQRQGYVEKKNAAPPPPPVGGGSPSIMPAPAKDFREANRRATQRVTNALGGLGGGNR